MRKYLLFLGIGMLCSFYSFSQDFSNKGKDFWVGYGYHQIMLPANGNLQEMLLYFATDQVTTVTVSIPGTGYSVTYPNIPANTVFSTPVAASGGIPKSGAQDARLLNVEGTFNKGIHIVADKPIIAYAHIYNSSVSGATILYPTNTLGKEYYSVNYTNNSNTGNSNCWFYVVATEPGTTTVEITPSANTLGGWVAGTTYTVNLTQGQIYNVLGILTTTNNGVDLTGSKIKSIAVGTQQCKRIAVFSGSGRIAISCNGTSPSSDNYMVQSLPKNAWGKKYLTVSSAHYNLPSGTVPIMPNLFRICVTDPTTVVTLNGAPIPYALINNFYYQIPATVLPQKIESDKPIMVAQYFPSAGSTGCNTVIPAPPNPTDGDPEVIYLSPVEQSINQVRWNACSNFAINTNKNYINVVIPNTGTAISSFRLDGFPLVPSPFTVHPQDPAYSYAVIRVSGSNVSPGVSHTVSSDSGFNAIAYGYGNTESYGYNAGTNVKDLYQQIGVATQYGIEPTPSVCAGSPFRFKVSLPYLADSIRWDLSALPGPPSPSSQFFTYPVPATGPDSTTIVNTKPIYWYSIPVIYSFNTIGAYNVNITTYSPDLEGCGTQQDIPFVLNVYDPPVAAFTHSTPGCVAETVQFNDATVSVKPNYHWYWDFGDPASGAANFSNLQNPTHLYTSPGTKTVRFASITTPGCLSDTIPQTFNVPAQPTATIAGTIAVCQNATAPQIVITGANGTPPYIFSYHINAGPIIQTAPAPSVTINVPTATAGPFTYYLDSVKNATGSALCDTHVIGQSATVTVNALPTATISGTTAVCQSSTAPTITFTGATGTLPYIFTYHIGAGPSLTVASPAGSSIATVTVPTGTAGPFTYTLTGVQDNSSTLCTNAAGGTATVTVNPLPTATISGTTELCLNATAPTITFTGAGATPPYKFTYTINSVTQPVLQSPGVSSVATITQPTTTAGPYVYNLVSVQESSSTTCSNNQSGTVTVTVDPQPTASFTYSAPDCAARGVTYTPTFGVGTGSVVSWIWDYGDGTGSHTRTDGLPFIITYATAGTKVVTFKTVSDKGCTSVLYTQNVVVSAKPKAGFINPEICLLDPFATFTDTSHVATGQPGTIVAWAWDFGDIYSTPGNPNTSSSQNPTHIYTHVGPYTVQQIITSSFGCKDTVSQNIVISDGNPQAGYNVLNPANLCSNDSVGIINKSTIASGNITKLEIYWDLLNQPGVFDTENDPAFNAIFKHKYPTLTTAQNYTIHVRAYSGGVCYSSKDTIITVHAAPVAQLTAIPDVCLNNGTVQFTQGSETGGVTGSGVYSGTGVSASGLFDPLVAGVGTHLITYTYTSNFGCVDLKTTNVKVLDPPVPNFSPALITCQNNAILFTQTSTATAGTIATWIWHWGDGTPDETYSNGNPRSHTYTVAGSYTATLSVITNYGCKGTPKSVTFTVNPQPHPQFTFTPIACLPQAKVDFVNTTIPGSITDWTYQWNFDDINASGTNPNTSTATNPSHIYTTATPFNVHLTATSPTTSCSHDTVIVVNPVKRAPVASFSVNKPSICSGQYVTVINNSSSVDGTITNWLWDYNDNTGTSTGVTQPPHQYTDGTYNIGLTVTTGFGCIDDTIIPFRVYPNPVANAGPDQIVLQGGTSHLQGTATGNLLTYLWRPHIYLNDSTILTPQIIPFENTTYVLYVTAEGGCTAKDSVYIEVLKAPLIPNTFTPNGDGVHDTWEIKYLFQYPGNTVQVFTRTGQLVFSSHGYSKPWDGTKEGKPLPFDTYYYIIEPGNGRAPMTGYVTIIK